MNRKFFKDGKQYQADIEDGDIMVFDISKGYENLGPALVFYGGTDELRSEAILEVAYNETEEGIEYDEPDVRHYISENLEEFVIRNWYKLELELI